MSTIKANDIQNASGGIPTVKGQRLIPTAWVNFNGMNTVTIRDSENVSSITDLGTGLYRVTFDTVLATADFTCIGTGSTNRDICTDTYSHSTSSIDIESREASNQAYVDTFAAQVAILGGQA